LDLFCLTTQLYECYFFGVYSIIYEIHFYLNKNVDINFSAHGAFLEYPSSGSLKAKIFESQIIKKKIGNKKPKNLNRIDTIV
jgi:hypothetical protein